jgi:hypothetical protein
MIEESCAHIAQYYSAHNMAFLPQGINSPKIFALAVHPLDPTNQILNSKRS